MNIKPIETRFKGYLFRSRTEARWAIVFDELGLKWEYEKEGYNLPGIGYYLPDFYLPKQNKRLWPGDMYIEIKGIEPTPEEMAKAHRLSILLGSLVIILAGMPGDHTWLVCKNGSKFFTPRYPHDDWWKIVDIKVNDLDVQHAYNQARSARFEHKI